MPDDLTTALTDYRDALEAYIQASQDEVVAKEWTAKCRARLMEEKANLRAVEFEALDVRMPGGRH